MRKVKINKDEEYLTVREVATKLKLSEFTVRRWIWSGELKAKMFGTRLRITSTSLDNFTRGQNWTPELCAVRTARRHKISPAHKPTR